MSNVSVSENEMNMVHFKINNDVSFIYNVSHCSILSTTDYYPDVTALFCDIVHFLQIIGSSKPGEVVNLLNCLYSQFDRITRVHDTYRVSTIYVFSALSRSLCIVNGR